MAVQLTDNSMNLKVYKIWFFKDQHARWQSLEHVTAETERQACNKLREKYGWWCSIEDVTDVTDETN